MLKKILIVTLIMLLNVTLLLAKTITQVVRGRVIDQESQTSLAGANIIITGSELGTMSDSNGNFNIPNVPVGRYDINISFIGYKPRILREVLVNSAKEVVLNIELKESPILMNEIVVEKEQKKEKSLNSMSTISARRFTVEETRRYAGGLDDPARLASGFAGVTSGNLQDNAIIVRGNAPKGVLWQVEGVTVPNPNHFPDGNVAGGGMMSILSSQLLSNSDFFTGAFPAEYGNALSGVFDIKMRKGNDEQREHTFQLGILGVDFATEGPFIKNSKASYLINYRYSTLSLVLPIIGTEQIPSYQDLSFKINLPTKNYGTFSLWSISGIDTNDEPVERDSTQWKFSWDRMKYKSVMKTSAIGLSHKILLNRKSYLNTSLVATGYSIYFDMDRVNDSGVLQKHRYIDNNTGTYTLKSYFNHKFNTRHTNRTGILINNLYYNIDIKARATNESPMQQVSTGYGNSNLLEFYSQSKYNITRNLKINLGFHSQYFMLNHHKTFEPRLGINWQFSPTQTLSFGYGNHSQMEKVFIYFNQQREGNETIRPNINLDFTKAHHFVLGYNKMLTENLHFRVEPYYQSIYNAPVIPDSSFSMLNYEREWQFNSNLVNEGTGENMGIDFTLERFLKDNFYYTLTAAFFDAEYTGGDGVKRNTRFNSGYVVNLLFGKEFFLGNNGKNNILGISGKLTSQGGRYRNPVDRERSLAEQEIYYDHTKAFADREKARNYLDISITYRVNKKHYSSVWALQVKNLLKAETSATKEYNYKTGEIVDDNQSILLPSLSYKIEF